jgi:seryl-tRNA synthetase
MADFRPAGSDQTAYRDDLVGAGLLIPMGVPGIYGRGAVFEDVRLAFERVFAKVAAVDGAEPMRFPPVIPRRHLESIGYLKSFPHLAASVFAFGGDEADAAEQETRAAHHEDWSQFQRMTDLVLSPAACYPVYPLFAERGRLPPGGATVDAGGAYVFRHEPSGDPMRQQMFHQREMVRLGEAAEVVAWRDIWRERGVELLSGLGLDVDVGSASDPFFGRGGRMLAANQREQALKFEITVPVVEPEPTAVASFNYHQEHFAGVFGLETADGAVAHTACLGFGEERVALALFRTHGLHPAEWPSRVRDRLWGSDDERSRA